jgi:hypothetical protein
LDDTTYMRVTNVIDGRVGVKTYNMRLDDTVTDGDKDGMPGNTTTWFDYGWGTWKRGG